MSKKAPKVRFVMNVLGSPRQLFSVSESNDKSLIVNVTIGIFKDHPDYGVKVRKSQKFSVHPTRAGSVLIKHEVIYEGGDVLDTTDTLDDISNGFFRPLFGRLCNALDAPEFLLNKRDGDKIIECGSYNPSRQTLVYLVHVMNIDASDPIFPDNIGQSFFHVEPFHRYKIFLSTVVIDVGSTKSGSTFPWSSGMSPNFVRRNKAPVPQIRQAVPNCWSVGAYPLNMFSIMLMAKEKILKFHILYNGPGSGYFELKRNLDQYFPDLPILDLGGIGGLGSL